MIQQAPRFQIEIMLNNEYSPFDAIINEHKKMKSQFIAFTNCRTTALALKLQYSSNT